MVARAAGILGQMGPSICAGRGLTRPCCPPELEPVQATQNKTGKYVPPSLRDGASRRGESMQPNRRGEGTQLPGRRGRALPCIL